MEWLRPDVHGHERQIASLVASKSVVDSGHIVNNAHADLSQQAQTERDSAVVEAQLHLSTMLGEALGHSSFEQQATFPKARQIVGGSMKSSQIITCFENGMQSRHYLQCLNPHDANREVTDGTIPTDPEHKRALVGIFVQAFRSTSNAQDKPKYLETFNKNKYDNRLVEARCWQILEFCIERSKRQALLRLWGGDKTKSEGSNIRDMKFADRYDSIVDLLATWKKSCDRVYQAPFLPQLVDNPDWTMKQTVNNAVSNNRKAILLDIAKQAEEEVVEQYSSPATTPSPTKRRKTTSTPTSSRRGSLRNTRSAKTIDRPPPPQFPIQFQSSVPVVSEPYRASTDPATPLRQVYDPHNNLSPLADDLQLQDFFTLLSETHEPPPPLNISPVHQSRVLNNLPRKATDAGAYSRNQSGEWRSHTASLTDVEAILSLGSWPDEPASAPCALTTVTLSHSQLGPGHYRANFEEEYTQHEIRLPEQDTVGTHAHIQQHAPCQPDHSHYQQSHETNPQDIPDLPYAEPYQGALNDYQQYSTAPAQGQGHGEWDICP